MSNPRIFISSTSIDLQPYREAAFKAIQSLGGYSDDMIFWSADERSGATLSLDRVRQSDALVLLLAHRYGHIPEGSDHSVTEMEFRTAQDEGIPVLAFAVDGELPWPPKFVESERAAELARFKELVRSKVTWQVFHSPDQLMALVTQSLVSFVTRQRQHTPRESRAFRGSIGTVTAPAELRTSPDALVQVGFAEDGVPLVLQVERSQDLAAPLSLIADAVSRPGAELPEAMFQTFQQSLEQYSRQAWARERVFPVEGRDGVPRNMYVTSSTLTTLFRPLFDAILQGRAHDPASAERSRGKGDTAIAHFSPGRESTARASNCSPARLQSVGGQNRFLGVSLDEDAFWSVGMQDSKWVEWRPFLFESLAANFPDGKFELRGAGSRGRPVEGALPGYIEALEAEAARSGANDGTVNLDPRFILSRASVARRILAIATLVERRHAEGRIHGDLKPSNVILTRDQPSLIDDFGLEDGDLAPGWTPDWSAPEQVLGNPVSPAADVYPLGLMLVHLLGGRLVGEVRKFRTVPLLDGRDEFDIFYDPYIHVEPTQQLLDTKDLRAWLPFVRSCLAFQPEQRIGSAAEFVGQLESLLTDHPLRGDVAVSAPGRLVVARLPGRVERVARLLTDAAP